MRALSTAMVLGLAMVGTASAEEAAAGPRDSRPAASSAPGPKRLNLGPYRSVHADDPAALADQLRFREEVEVRGKPMDSASLTAKLEWWMKDIDLSRGATPATLSAPSLHEMRDYRPHPADAVNLMPVVEWLTERISGKKK